MTNGVDASVGQAAGVDVGFALFGYASKGRCATSSLLADWVLVSSLAQSDAPFVVSPLNLRVRIGELSADPSSFGGSSRSHRTS